MTTIQKHEMRPLVVTTLTRLGKNPAMYNVAGIIKYLWGDELNAQETFTFPEFLRAADANRRKSWRQCGAHDCTNDAVTGQAFCAEGHEGEIDVDTFRERLQEFINCGVVEFSDALAMFPTEDIDYPAVFAEGVECGQIGVEQLEEAAPGFEVKVVGIEEYNEMQSDVDGLISAIEDNHYEMKHDGPFQFCYDDLCRKALDRHAY